MFGFADPEEAIGTLLFDLVAPDARAAVFLECLRRDGGTILVETITSPIEFEGQSARSLNVREATEHRQPDIALREANERFRLAFDGAPIGMALVGVDGRWLQVNPALCGIVGYAPDELFTKTFQDITHPDDLDADLEFVRRVLADEIASYSMEKRYFTPTATRCGSTCRCRSCTTKGAPRSTFVSRIEDVTERKRVEEACAPRVRHRRPERAAVAANEAECAEEAAHPVLRARPLGMTQAHVN